MRGRRGLPLAVAVAIGGALLLGQPPGPSGKSPKGASLPALGTRLGQFPAGPMKSVADQACLNCHSADMVCQQRLTQKQWSAEVTKMIGWGAVVPEERKDALVAYLLQNFGPDNDRFRPVVARPLGR